MLSASKTSSQEHGTQIVLVVDGQVSIVDSNHPNFYKILTLLDERNVDGIPPLLNVEQALKRKLSDKVNIQNGELYYLTTPIFDTLAQAIMSAASFDDTEQLNRLVQFFENLMENPSKQSIAHLYNWLQRHHLSLTDDGHFYAYKGVTEEYLSKYSGKGVVNGMVYLNSRLENRVGNVVYISRDDVDPNYKESCSYGLHVGDLTYAENWGERVVKVKVNPRDVVVVLDDDSRKMRVCRYEVVSEESNPLRPTQFDTHFSTPLLRFANWLEDITRGYAPKSRVAWNFKQLAQRYDFNDATIAHWADSFDLLHDAEYVYKYHVDAFIARIRS